MCRDTYNEDQHIQSKKVATCTDKAEAKLSMFVVATKIIYIVNLRARANNVARKDEKWLERTLHYVNESNNKKRELSR